MNWLVIFLIIISFWVGAWTAQMWIERKYWK